MLSIEIDSAIIQRFPEIRVSAMIAVGLDRASAPLARLAPNLVSRAAAAVRTHFTGPEDIVADQRIVGFRDAIRACGLKAADVRSSVEQLLRRFLRDDGIGDAPPLVQAYCAISAKNVAPLGAYDLSRLPGAVITLRGANARDRFVPLGGSARVMSLTANVAVYAAADEVLCWAFNHRDSAVTALRPETSCALFVGESVTCAQRDSLAAAFSELRCFLEQAGTLVGAIAMADAEASVVSVAAPVEERSPHYAEAPS